MTDEDPAPAATEPTETDVDEELESEARTVRATPVSPVPTTYDIELWTGADLVLLGLIFHTPVGSSTYFLDPNAADRLADRLRHSARSARHRQREKLVEVHQDVLDIVQGNGKLIIPRG
jgi:hypothetical protein